MSDAGMCDNEKILCLTGTSNVAAYQEVHKLWCSVHTTWWGAKGWMRLNRHALCAAGTLGHRWCVNLANNWGEQQLVERTVLISYDQLHIKDACKGLWGLRGRRVQTKKEPLLQIRVGYYTCLKLLLWMYSWVMFTTDIDTDISLWAESQKAPLQVCCPSLKEQDWYFIAK